MQKYGEREVREQVSAQGLGQRMARDPTGGFSL